MPIKYTLLADGSSDRCLMPIIDWVLFRLATHRPADFVAEFADLRILSDPALLLPDRMQQAIAAYPCDLLFIHRDAERVPWADRRQEIREAVAQIGISNHVAVIPVRMTEAWLLTNESALRRAADNPNGTIALNLPLSNRIEGIPDPKNLLKNIILTASEKHGRHAERIRRDVNYRTHRVAALTDDFSPLLSLQAFKEFYAEAQEAWIRLTEIKT